MNASKKIKKGGLVGHHAQDAIPAESLPLAGLGASGSNASAYGVGFAGWVLPVGKLFLDFYGVVEHQALSVLPSFVDGWSVFNKEVPHNRNSVA